MRRNGQDKPWVNSWTKIWDWWLMCQRRRGILLINYELEIWTETRHKTRTHLKILKSSFLSKCLLVVWPASRPASSWGIRMGMETTATWVSSAKHWDRVWVWCAQWQLDQRHCSFWSAFYARRENINKTVLKNIQKKSQNNCYLHHTDDEIPLRTYFRCAAKTRNVNLTFYISFQSW